MDKSFIKDNEKTKKMFKVNNEKELLKEDLNKLIDEVADQLKSDFLAKKKEQIKFCTRDIYNWFHKNADRTFTEGEVSSKTQCIARKCEHVTSYDLKIIMNRLVEKKHIIKNNRVEFDDVRAPGQEPAFLYSQYMFNLDTELNSLQ